MTIGLKLLISNLTLLISSLSTYCRIDKRPRLVPRPRLADVDTLVEVHGEGGLAGHRDVDRSYFDEEVLSQVLSLPDVNGPLIQLELHEGVVVEPAGLHAQGSIIRLFLLIDGIGPAYLASGIELREALNSK